MTRYGRMVLNLDSDLSEEEYTAALAAVSAVPGVWLSHYILNRPDGSPSLKVLDISSDGTVTAVQG